MQRDERFQELLNILVLARLDSACRGEELLALAVLAVQVRNGTASFLELAMGRLQLVGESPNKVLPGCISSRASASSRDLRSLSVCNWWIWH